MVNIVACFVQKQLFNGHYFGDVVGRRSPPPPPGGGRHESVGCKPNFPAGVTSTAEWVWTGSTDFLIRWADPKSLESTIPSLWMGLAMACGTAGLLLHAQNTLISEHSSQKLTWEAR